MKKITVPYKYTPRDYQLPFLQAMDKGCKRAVLVWHRRAGKDKTVLNYLIKKMIEKVGTYYYFFPTYSQGKKILWDGKDKTGMPFLEHFPQELVVNKHETELKITLKNGSIFQIIGTDKIDAIVGTNPIGCVFSEYALQNPKAWDYIRPILAENGGWAVFVYTPRGMNHGWKILQQAKESSNWFWQVLTVNDTKAISDDVLDEEKKEMPQDLFEQEYYCKFIEGASQFFRRIEENVVEPKTKPGEGHEYQLGVDLAKYQDYTVITPFDLNTFIAHNPERFNQMDWNLQKSKIESFYYRYFRPTIWLDSSGLGDPIYDDLVNKGINNVQPYKFTEKTRQDLLNNLRILLEQDKIKIPANEVLIEELKSFQYELTDRGKVRIAVPEGLHDDTVMSLALAVWNIPQNPKILPKSSIARFLTREGIKDEVYITDYK